MFGIESSVNNNTISVLLNSTHGNFRNIPGATFGYL